MIEAPLEPSISIPLLKSGKGVIMVPYKIAVYTISKNEVTNVDKWISSMMEADYLCVLDTGSTDGTWERLVEWREKYPDKIILSRAEIKPWRFDVARNANMRLIPKDADFCISTDLDEILVPGWGDKFREAWDKSNKHRMWYKYAWSQMERQQECSGMTNATTIAEIGSGNIRCMKH